MSKSANLNIRMQPEIKEEAEKIISKLGIPASNAIDMFYRQKILNKGLPFEVKIPESQLKDITEISREELNTMLRKGLEDLEEGRFSNVDHAFKSIYEQL